jgi:hypothetical protein
LADAARSKSCDIRTMKAETPDQYFSTREAPMAALAVAVRGRVRARAPHLTEALAWGFPCYTGNERVFSIIAHKGHVNLQLWNGARLAGDHLRIAGTGAQLRHVKLKTAAEIDSGLDAIIDAAVALDRTDPQLVR